MGRENGLNEKLFENDLFANDTGSNYKINPEIRMSISYNKESIYRSLISRSFA